MWAATVFRAEDLGRISGMVTARVVGGLCCMSGMLCCRGKFVKGASGSLPMLLSSLLRGLGGGRDRELPLTRVVPGVQGFQGFRVSRGCQPADPET